MTVKSINELNNRGIEIDLTGPQGNAFCLLGMAKSYAEQMGRDQEYIDGLLERMQGSDYDHLVQVFDSEFGNFVTLYK